MVALETEDVRLIGVIAVLSGCFYVPSVNQRPGLEIRNNGAQLERDGTAEFEAIVVDPEADGVALAWRVYACGEPPEEPVDFGDCDAVPFFEGTASVLDVPKIPAFREPVGIDPARPTQGIRVTLDARDDRGAGAKPGQVLALPVGNARPVLRFNPIDSVDSDYGLTVLTPIRVYAAFGDVDDTPANVTLAWEFFAPSEVPFAPATPIPQNEVPPPPEDLEQQGMKFTPTVEGNWQVRVTATDPAGATTAETITIVVVPDIPPCLDVLVPEIIDGTTLPVFEPRLFSSTVDDNLDIYPYADIEDNEIEDPSGLIDPALFTWSVKVGTGARDLVVDTEEQNSYAFDPTAYPVGTIVEIRVEIEDRVERTLTCPDGDASCAVVSGSGCFQRRTWRVEAR